MGIRPLPADLQALAIKNINEDPARIPKDIEYIKEWLKKQPHLKARTDDQWILAFLRGCKFSLERTKEKIDAYYTLRSALPEFFKNRDPMSPEAQAILNCKAFLTLPEPDDNGRRVSINIPALMDPSHMSSDETCKVHFLQADIKLFEDDRSFICGEIMVCDLQNASMAHATMMSPATMKKMMTMFQDGYPFRPQALHYVNMPTFFEVVFNTFKAFMKEKLRKRLFFHSNFDELHKHVPKRILPTEFGGDAGPMAVMWETWKKDIEKHRDFFKDDDKYGTDESKRPGKPKTRTDLFGVEGSFRQLNVD